VKLPALTPRRLAIVALGATAALVGAFAAGRWSRPAMVTETTQTQRLAWAEREEVRARRTETTERVRVVERVKVVYRPDGSTQSETRTTSREGETSQSGTSLSANATSNGQAEQKTVTVEKPVHRDWHLSAQAGWDKAQARPNVYGVAVERRIAGPVWLGVWGQSTRAGGVSVGLEW
jgi:hypothetical protein